MNSDIADKILICFLAAVVIFWPIAAAVRWKKRKNEEKVPKEGSFAVRVSKGDILALIIMTFILYLFFVLSIFALDADLLTFIVFLAFPFLGVLACFILLFCEIEVTRECIMYYRPLLPVKRIEYSEITKIMYLENSSDGQHFLNVYKGKKKLFCAEERLEDFWRLVDFFANEIEWEGEFEAAGGADRKLLKNVIVESGLQTAEGVQLYSPDQAVIADFSVTEVLSEKCRDGIIALLFTGLFIASVCDWREMIEEDYYLLIYIGLAGLAIMSLASFIPKLFKKISVSGHTIRVRNALGRVKTYHIQEISEIAEEQHNLILYVGENQEIKVPKDYHNYVLFVDWLCREMTSKKEE